MSEPRPEDTVEGEGDRAPAEAEDTADDAPVDLERVARLSKLDTKIRRRDRQIRMRAANKANGIRSKPRPAAQVGETASSEAGGEAVPVEGGRAPLPEGLDERLAIVEDQVEFLTEAFAEGLDKMQLTADELRGELEPIREAPRSQEAALEKIDDRLRRLETQLTNSTGDLEQRLQVEIERLKRRVETLDSKVREAARRAPAPKAGAKRQAASSSRKRTPAKRRRKASSEDATPKDTVDLNEATFEQLRELGLSAAHALRVLSARETRKGFASVEDLDAVIPGLPEELQGELKRRLVVPSGGA